MLPRRRSDPDDRPNAEGPMGAGERREAGFRKLPRKGDERPKSEPPSSDRPVLVLLNPEIRSAELPGLVPPSPIPAAR
jgi:hypothetical protein